MLYINESSCNLLVQSCLYRQRILTSAFTSYDLIQSHPDIPCDVLPGSAVYSTLHRRFVHTPLL